MIASILASLAAEAAGGAAHAAEAAGHGEGGGLKLLPDLPTLVQQTVLFTVLALVLWKFAWKGILEALDARERRIREDLEKAESARKASEEALARREAELDRVKAEAQAILEEGKADALRLKERILSEARDEAAKIAERSRREIELARDKAVADLQAQAAALSLSMAAKILGREVNAADQDRLVQESLAEFKRQAMN